MSWFREPFSVFPYLYLEGYGRWEDPGGQDEDGIRKIVGAAVPTPPCIGHGHTGLDTSSVGR